MIKNWPINDKKKFLVQALQRVNSQESGANIISEIMKGLRLEPESGSPESTCKDQIAAWIIQNYSLIKNSFQIYFESPEYRVLSDTSRNFLINLIKNYSKKINQQKMSEQVPPNQMYAPKNNYGPYPPYNYMYSNQPNAMYPSMMYPPHVPYYANNEQFQKMYRQNFQYYMQMQQMQMNYPPYMPGYMNPEQYGNLMKHGYANTNPIISDQPQQSQPQSQPQQPNMIQPPMSNQTVPPKPGMSQPQSNNNGYRIQVSKQRPQNCPAPPKQSGSSTTKSIEEYEESFKRYYELYGKKLGKEAPFMIIPPSKQKRAKQIQKENLLKKKSLQASKQTTENKADDSDLEIVQDLQPKKLADPIKSSNLPVGKKRLPQPNQQLAECLCRGYIDDSNTFTCLTCSEKFHYDCLKKKKHGETEHLAKINCHFCVMRKIDPLNEAVQDIKHRYVENINSQRVIETFNFQNFDSYIMTESRMYQIQIRCMRLDDAVNDIADYTWPDESVINLNSDKAIEFPALQLHSSVKKRKDSSIFLTYKIYHENKNAYLRNNSKISMEIKNITQADMTQKKIRNDFVFIMGFYLTKKKTVDELYQEILNIEGNKVRFAKNYFNEPQQEQIAIQQIKVNLTDPYTWNLIETPVRGVKCVHGQCFDLKTYISFMNVQKNRVWKCPVCNKECRQFLIDIQQLQAIQEYKNRQFGNNKSLTPQAAFHRDGRTVFSIEKDSEEESEIKQDKKQQSVVNNLNLMNVNEIVEQNPRNPNP